MLDERDAILLRQLAGKYIWWKEAEKSLRYPDRVIGQVMDLGSFQDLQRLHEHFGVARLSEVLGSAEAGWFSPRSWHYWHYRLGLAAPGQVPPLPGRKLA